MAVVIGGLVSVVGLAAIGLVHWPAYSSSNVTRTLTTFGHVVCIVVLALCAWGLSRAAGPRASAAYRAVACAATAAMVTVTLSLPLGATKLYLGGITVDQQFRTEFLTRFTQSPALHDMTYIGLPPFYSPGWFWLGGRFASITGLTGWEAFKPWSVLSLAVACALALALWFAVVSPARAIAAALATTIAMLAYGSAEPYGAVVTVLMPPLLILAWRALTGSAGWLAVLAVGVYLGAAVWFYTLYLGVAAFAVCVLGVAALGVAWRRRRTGGAASHLAVIGRVAAMGGVAFVLALPAYAPVLAKMAAGEGLSKGSAFHYLPDMGTVLPLPMLHASLPGLLALIGIVWSLVRLRTSDLAQASALMILSMYLWALLSMAATLAGSTLLGFRTESVLHVVLAAAGALGVVDLVAALCTAAGPGARLTAFVLAALAGIGVAQTVPQQLSGVIATAYSDTDGNGVRADARPAGAEKYYPEVDRVVRKLTARPRTDSVVLTADYGFLAVYPYWGFQNLTSNYANPLADFGGRAAAIERWSKASSPDELVRDLDTLKWRPPNVFLFRTSDAGLTLRLAKDVYPNSPNISRYTVTFPASLFDDPRFEVRDVGPFTVVVRK